MTDEPVQTRFPPRPGSAASSYSHQSAAGQIAALGKGFTGFRGSHGVGKEDGKWLDLIRETHRGLVPAGNHSRHMWLLGCLFFSLLVSEGE